MVQEPARFWLGVEVCPKRMKRREMNSLARSLSDYLSSRNNDIAGYWGIGMLCAASKREGKKKFSFKIYPGQLIKIYGCEVSGSRVVTDKLVHLGLDSIEGRLSFFEDGRYPHGAEKYTCGIAIAVTQGGRTGMSLSHIACWPHDPSREWRRAGFEAAEASWIARFKGFLNCGRG
ncbi:MAG: hypothetical protein ACFCVE_10280 [Phycisphaerae bacterium]